MTRQQNGEGGNPRSPDLAPDRRADSADELDARLYSLETLYAKGRFEDTIARGELELERELPAQARGRVRLFVAMANLSLGRMKSGEQMLADARADIEAVGDEVLLVECMASEAYAAQMRQRPEAVHLAEQALFACRKLAPIPRPLEARILNALAAASVAASDWEGAVAAYEEAIERAASLYDMNRQAKLLSDVSIAYGELGQLDRSVICATRSVELLEALRDFVALARSENNLGLSLMSSGDLASARRHLTRSLDLCEQTNLEIGRCHVLLSLCELNMADGRYADAQLFAKQALASALGQGEASSVAQAHVWLGRAASALNQSDVSDSEFEQAIEQLTRNGESVHLMRCHALYGDVLEHRGELHRAYLQMKAAVAQAAGSRPKRGPGKDIRF